MFVRLLAEIRRRRVIETVAPYLVDEILACDKSGHKIRWLNPNKIMGRMIKGMIKKRPDQFEPFGL